MRIFILFLTLLLNQTTFADCGRFLETTNDTATNSVTDQFLSFVGVLLEQGIVSSKYIEVLAKGELKNPFDTIRFASKQDIYEPYFTAYFEQDLDKGKIQNWAQRKLNEDQTIQQQREKTQNGTKDGRLKIRFHNIRAGKFILNDPGNEHWIDIAEDFEMMNTVVTEWQWAQMAILAGQTSKDFLETNRDDAAHRDEYPVVNVSYEMLDKVLSKINQMSKEDQYQQALEIIFPGHQKGAVYALPTSKQWHFVIHNRGLANKRYFDRDDTSELAQYAHFYDPALGRERVVEAQPVATKWPRLIDGKAFYDLEGNVGVLVKNPYKNDLGFKVYICGGCNGSTADNLYFRKSDLPIDQGYSYVGIRLVRTLPSTSAPSN